jgi:hypothetical protein
VLSGLLLAAAGAAGAVYLGAVAVVLYEAPRGGPWGMLGAGFLLLFLLGAGLRVARGFRGGEETGWADRGLDRRTLRVREER